MKDSRFIIGIDLGTTNSTLSYVDTQGEVDAIKVFDIPQVGGEGTVRNLDALPSFLYLPGEYELPKGSIALPWEEDIPYVVGEFARVQGARVPSNLVSSAKSWLCNNRVDRNGPILPWGREAAPRRVSPVEASSYYLRHLKDAWNHRVAGGDSALSLERQQVVITIPASFDEVARELTSEAARIAGIEEFTLLEEPQAAFYSWIALHNRNWLDLAGKDRLILIFDVGGGTTDFTLISLTEDSGRPVFKRVAVGDHLMLGGDNMDLALARRMEQSIMGSSGKFDFQQWLSVTQQCRIAKEDLLGDSGKNSVTISVLGHGRSVVGGSRTAELTADETSDVILDGFFRKVATGEEMERRRPSGLQELGLPFETDTSVMKHLCSFLKRHAVNRDLRQIVDAGRGMRIVRPDILLFNGGVFRSASIRQQATDVIREWFSDGLWSLTVLDNERLDHAVSIGAAYYGMVLRGKGERISGGTSKSYYIGVEAADRAGQRGESTFQNPVTSVCIFPRGAEEGQEVHLASPEFQAMTNRPVNFTLYSSSYRSADNVGDIIVAERDEFIELPPVRTVLRFGKSAGSVRIPVSLGIRLNEFGTLDVWCESRKTPHRWKLAFHLRKEETSPLRGSPGIHTLDESAVDEAVSVLTQALDSGSGCLSGVTPENVIRHMETALGLGRNNWSLSAIRKMWDSLIVAKERRQASPRHEARWLNLSGFLLRPGFGYQLDDWRIRELWKLFSEGLVFSGDAQCRAEWWILWRRVAGGLDDLQQEVLFRKIVPAVLPSKKKGAAPRLQPGEVMEMWMLAASLERLSAEVKVDLGNEVMGNLKRAKGKTRGQYYWALSRIGARVPFHGPLDRVVPAAAAEVWIEDILKTERLYSKDTVYAAAQLVRRTNDRIRDIDDSLRARVIEAFSPLEWAQHYVAQIRDVMTLADEDETKMFGESLPEGLSIQTANVEPAENRIT